MDEIANMYIRIGELEYTRWKGGGGVVKNDCLQYPKLSKKIPLYDGYMEESSYFCGAIILVN